jgi:hypothetical protein
MHPIPPKGKGLALGLQGSMHLVLHISREPGPDTFAAGMGGKKQGAQSPLSLAMSLAIDAARRTLTGK